MTNDKCPDLEISSGGDYECAPYFRCKSNKWNYEFSLDVTDRNAIREYCCTMEHKRCVMSSDFVEDTPDSKILRIVIPKPILTDSTFMGKLSCR